MEDKTFELLEKMYAEFSKRFENQDKKIDSMGNELMEIKQKTSYMIDWIKWRIKLIPSHPKWRSRK